MLLIEAKDYNDMSRKAANIISAQVIMKPHAVLGLATGSTPVGAYKQLVEWYNKGDLDFANVTSVNLDEYKGLSPENDQSYRYFMNTNLFNHVNINKERTFVPNGLDPEAKKHVGKYSLGMRQRLGIAQAIMEEPSLLILDEPMNGLDNQGVQEMRQLFLKLKDEGKTILLASHNREDIAALCDTTVEIDRGKIVG